MNQVTLVGNVTDDLTLKQAKNNNKNYTQFTLAVDYYYDGTKHAEFFDIVAFGKKAEQLSKYITKGRKLLVVGRLRNSLYTTEGGIKRTYTKVVLEDFEFMDFKKEVAATAE